MLGVTLCLAVIASPFIAAEKVDLVELNHFHDALGRHVYDQVIFYEWSHEHNEYHVRSWKLVDERTAIDVKPRLSEASRVYESRWFDREERFYRVVRAEHYRESWTQIDPERENKKLLHEQLRVDLVKRELSHDAAPSLPIEVPDGDP